MYTYEGQQAAPGHEPPVKKVTRSMCPTSGKTSYALACERPTYPETTGTIPRWGNHWENGTTNRRRTLATDGHLCVHTIGSSGLFGLGHSFHIPQPEFARMRTGKTGAFVSTETAARRGSSTV